MSSLSLLDAAAWNWSVQDIETYLYQRCSRPARKASQHVMYNVFTEVVQPCLNDRTPFIYDTKRKTVVTVEVPVQSSTIPLTDFYTAFAWLISVSQPELSNARDALHILGTFARLCDHLHRQFFGFQARHNKPALLPVSVNLICGWISVELSEGNSRDVERAIPSSSARHKLREARKSYVREMWRLSDPPAYWDSAETLPESTACVSLDTGALGKLRKFKENHVCAHARELCLSCGCWISLPARPLHVC